MQLAHRPDMGQSGRPIEVMSNTFEIRSFPKAMFHHYDEILPPIKNAARAAHIMQRLQVHTAPQIFHTVPVAYDCAKNLFSLQQLFDQGFLVFDVCLSDRVPAGPDSKSGYKVTLKKVGEVNPGDLQKILSGSTPGLPVSTTPLQALNVFFQQAAALKFPVHTKQKFFVEDGREDYNELEIWRGFFQSIRPSINRLLINVDMATGVMYRRGPLIDFVLSYLREHNERALFQLQEHSPQWTRIRGLLKSLKIIQLHSNRLRTVKSLVPCAGEYEFRLQSGEAITVADYFAKNHQIHLRKPRLPGIVTTKDEVIPFELCNIKEGQMFKKKTSPETVSRLLTFAKKSPSERFKIIQSGVTRLQLGDSPFVVQAGMSVSDTTMKVKGRVLEPPRIIYGGNSQENPKGGAWNMLHKRLLEPKSISSWAVVHFLKVQPEAVMRFVRDLVKAMRAVGMNIKNEQPEIVEANASQVHEELFKLSRNVAPGNNEKPSLLLVILPDNAAQIRRDVKQFGDIRYGIMTQCVKLSKIMRANNQYHNNLILKINAKLGGVNSAPTGPSFDWFRKGKSIVMGADVTHASPGVLRPSVAAVVSSIDENAAKYISALSIQKPRVEIIADLQGMVEHCLQMFNKYRRHLQTSMNNPKVPIWPECLIFYRDGVSEGEIQYIVDNEISKIQAALETMQRNTGVRCQLTYVIVGKRHHIRFMPMQQWDQDKTGNAPAGLVVDDNITMPGIFDFYLQSHSGILGTSRPSHYVVIKDDNGFNSDRLQSFSFALCHTYARATRSVSIPAPCYYADIACSRANFHFNPDLNFSDDLSSVGNISDFNMDEWQKGFAKQKDSTQMYFI